MKIWKKNSNFNVLFTSQIFHKNRNPVDEPNKPTQYAKICVIKWEILYLDLLRFF